MQVRYIVGAALVFAALAVAAVSSYFTSQVAYFTVDELLARPGLVPPAAAAGVVSDPSPVGEGPRYQVRGNLDLATVNRPQEGLGMRFDLFGKTGRIPVAYRGVVPDTFEKAEAITVGGRFASNGTFVADELLVQCPSRYQAKLGTPTPASLDLSNG